MLQRTEESIALFMAEQQLLPVQGKQSHRRLLHALFIDTKGDPDPN